MLHFLATVCKTVRPMLSDRCLLARLQTWRAVIFSRVCLSVCLSLTGTSTLPSTLTDFDETWSQGPYSDLVLAATIIFQIGRWGTARRLFENLKKFSKITVFEFQNSGPAFLRLCLLCIVNKKASIRWQDTRKAIDCTTTLPLTVFI